MYFSAFRLILEGIASLDHPEKASIISQHGPAVRFLPGADAMLRNISLHTRGDACVTVEYSAPTLEQCHITYIEGICHMILYADEMCRA